MLARPELQAGRFRLLDTATTPCRLPQRAAAPQARQTMLCASETVARLAPRLLQFLGGRIEPHDKCFHRPRDVLQRQRADRLERQIETPVHMVPHRARDADAAYRALCLQSSGDVHAVAMQVSAVRDHVANVDADAEANAPVRRLIAVIDRHLLLYLDRAAHRAVDAVERDQQRVAAGLHHSAAVLADGRVDQCASQRAQAVQRTGIVQSNQAAVADHVGIDDSDELPAARGLTGEGEFAARGRSRQAG